jgi:hypothetical protein
MLLAQSSTRCAARRSHLIAVVSGLLLTIGFSSVAQAAKVPTAPKIKPIKSTLTVVSMRDMPICYGVMPGKGSMLNLDRLCGVGKTNNGGVIDLSVDVNRDGVPDQLLAEMKKFRDAVAKAQAPEEYRLANERLEDRMPYSASVKQLQAQQRQLQREAQDNPNPSEATYRKLSELQEKIYRDPSYQKVQEAMSKVYSKLN